VGIIVELNRQISDLEAELATHFEAHPDADIYRSPPGLGVILGARVLGEFGHDPNRYTTAKSRKNYAGTSPLTVASGSGSSSTLSAATLWKCSTPWAAIVGDGRSWRLERPVGSVARRRRQGVTPLQR